MMLLVKILLVVFFVIPIIGATAFGVISAIAMSDADRMKEENYHVR